MVGALSVTPFHKSVRQLSKSNSFIRVLWNLVESERQAVYRERERKKKEHIVLYHNVFFNFDINVNGPYRTKS